MVVNAGTFTLDRFVVVGWMIDDLLDYPPVSVWTSRHWWSTCQSLTGSSLIF